MKQKLTIIIITVFSCILLSTSSLAFWTDKIDTQGTIVFGDTIEIQEDEVPLTNTIQQEKVTIKKGKSISSISNNQAATDKVIAGDIPLDIKTEEIGRAHV